MRILFVCHRFPFPPQRGGKIRPFNVIRHLSERHDVVVASPVRTAEELEVGTGLTNHCSRVITEKISARAALAQMIVRFPTTAPSSSGYFYSPGLAKRIATFTLVGGAGGESFAIDRSTRGVGVVAASQPGEVPRHA